MKKMMMLCVLCVAFSGCIGNGGPPLPADDDNVDAGLPDDMDASTPDACPTPDATVPVPTGWFRGNNIENHVEIMAGASLTLSWHFDHADECQIGGAPNMAPDGSRVVYPTTSINIMATCHGPGGSVVKTLIVTVNPLSTCDDGLNWTEDWYNGDGTCGRSPIDCGGKKVRVTSGQTITGTVTCGFWGGFGVPPDQAPDLGRFTVGNSWTNAPAHACSATVCYDSAGHVVRIDSEIMWNGSTFQNQTFTGLLKATWDGHNQQQ
jgi:hypothetical protein